MKHIKRILIAVRVDEETAEALRYQARVDEKTVSEIIRAAINKFLGRN